MDMKYPACDPEKVVPKMGRKKSKPKISGAAAAFMKGLGGK